MVLSPASTQQAPEPRGEGQEGTGPREMGLEIKPGSKILFGSLSKQGKHLYKEVKIRKYVTWLRRRIHKSGGIQNILGDGMR